MLNEPVPDFFDCFIFAQRLVFRYVVLPEHRVFSIDRNAIQVFLEELYPMAAEMPYRHPFDVIIYPYVPQ